MKPFDSDEEDAEQLAAYQKELRREWDRFSALIRLAAKRGVSCSTGLSCHTALSSVLH